jgi:DNA-binding Lrp family transcriptional regulator
MGKNIDIALLSLLERDSSLSEKELAIALSISGKEVKTELTKLREQGVYRWLPSHHQLG